MRVPKTDPSTDFVNLMRRYFNKKQILTRYGKNDRLSCVLFGLPIFVCTSCNPRSEPFDYVNKFVGSSGDGGTFLLLRLCLLARANRVGMPIAAKSMRYSFFRSAWLGLAASIIVTKKPR